MFASISSLDRKDKMSQRKLRVLEMIDDASIGGGQIHVLMLAKYLDKDRFDISIACEGEGFLVDEARAIGVNVIPVSMDNTLKFRTLSDVRSLLKRGHFDIIHTHGGTPGFWGRLGSMLISPRPCCVHTYHGIHYLSKSSLSSRLYCFVDRWFLRSTDVVVTVCRSDFDQGLRAGVVSKENGVVIVNGIEVDRFNDESQRKTMRNELGITDSTIVFVNVGRLHVQKGHKILLGAFSEVYRVHPNSRLWLIGDGELRKDLEQIVTDLKIDHAVTFFGSRRDVPQLLAAADVFVLSSLWEGQPITVIEAMVIGKPIIATSVDGIIEMLIHEDNALLVPPRSISSLSTAMMRLINEPSLRKRLSSSARVTAMGHFTAQRMADQIGELYISVFKKHGTT
jgi:glycosyltransferase involved in cell wall biosynthesis